MAPSGINQKLFEAVVSALFLSTLSQLVFALGDPHGLFNQVCWEQGVKVRLGLGTGFGFHRLFVCRRRRPVLWGGGVWERRACRFLVKLLNGLGVQAKCLRPLGNGALSGFGGLVWQAGGEVLKQGSQKCRGIKPGAAAAFGGFSKTQVRGHHRQPPGAGGPLDNGFNQVIGLLLMARPGHADMAWEGLRCPWRPAACRPGCGA